MIVPVDSPADRSALRALLEEFHGWMAAHAGAGYDVDAELAEDRRSLGRTSESRAWIARVDGDPAGCVLLYGASADLAEFKRLWVRPAYRGQDIGRSLVRTVIGAARARGDGTLRVTTPPWGDAADALYASMGFERTPRYPETRLPEEHRDDAVFMQLPLDESSDGSAGE